MVGEEGTGERNTLNQGGGEGEGEGKQEKNVMVGLQTGRESAEEHLN